MFEHIILRRAENGLPISAGQIAEALLYYQKVHVVIDRGTLIGLVKQIGTGPLLGLFNRSDLTAVYCEEMLATHTESLGNLRIYSYLTFRMVGSDKVGTLKSVAERVEYDLKKNGVARKDAQHFAKIFTDRIPVRKFSGNHFLEGGIDKASRQELSDTDYMRSAMRMAVQLTPGGYDPGDSYKFEIFDTEIGFHVFTDIDFERINKRRAALIPPLEPITVAHFLSHILDARMDLALASFYGGDFVTSAITSSIIQVRYNELLRRSALNATARRQFSEVTLPDSPSIAEVIDSGERTFAEFLALLNRASQFKQWLKGVNPDENLVRTYLRDISSEIWIQRLPAKSLRYVFTLGLDAANPVAGLVAGFIDNFLLEKLFGGWRPNHFVTSHLGPFSVNK